MRHLKNSVYERRVRNMLSAKSFLGIFILLVFMLVRPAMAENTVFRFEKGTGQIFEGEQVLCVLVRQGDAETGEVTFVSSNEKTAVVDEKGYVTGLSKGRTTISAILSTGKRTYRTQWNLTVARKVTHLAVSAGKALLCSSSDPVLKGLVSGENELPVLVLPVRKSCTLQVSALPKDATDRNVEVTSSDSGIIRVNGTGLTAVSCGEAIVSVRSRQNPEIMENILVFVTQPVTRIELTAAEKQIYVGGQLKVEASLLPDSASIKNVTYSSSDDRIASVDAQGVITGYKRGNVRITATAADGSSTRASIALRVMQKATEIMLDRNELTLDAGRNAMLKATVLPRDADDKSVIWSSMDESVATVNAQGRVYAIKLGECDVICTSKTDGHVIASAHIIVQQPVTKIVFDEEMSVYMGETGRLVWHVEPEDATNPAVAFTSGNRNILTVAEDGTVVPLKVGEAYVNAASTDGSNRHARVKVKVLQHVEGVHMVRRNAYIDVRESANAGARLEPENASNKHMTWSSADESIVKVSGDLNRVRLTGVSKGETVVTGVTADGGFETSIQVKVGSYDKTLQLRSFTWDGKGLFSLRVRNAGNVTVTKITAHIQFTDKNGQPVAVNTQDGSNEITAVWTGTLNPGETTGKKAWKMNTYKAPDMGTTKGKVILTSFQIEDDWVKTIRKNNQPVSEW